MKKNIILIALMYSGFVFSQIGINTSEPKATFDINAKNAAGTSRTAEGLLIPRIDRQRAQSMTGVQTSTLIYINSISTGTQTGTAINVDVIGYYYFNGTEWAKLITENGTPQNFYNSNGTLTGNRTVSQGASTLAFTGTATNAFSVDDTTFSVDAANNRVGIGNNNPSQSLTVVDPTNLNRFQGVASFMANNLSQGLGIGHGGIQSVGTNTNINLNLNAKSTGKIILQTESTGSVGIGTYYPNSNTVLDLSSTTKGFLPPRLTTAQRDAIASKPAGAIIYNTTLNCMQYWNGTAWAHNCAGIIAALNCAGAIPSGTLTRGVAASGVSSSIPYTGGNGGIHNGQTVTSTGVTGLTATLAAGRFANGAGNLSYTITGTPSAVGTASFAINIGGKTCTITRTVINPVGIIGALNCAGAIPSGTLIRGVAASGVSSSIPYTGGNGGTHSGQTVASTGVTGLTAKLNAGTFANGSGNLTYTITGTPSAAGTASFAINIGGKTCTLTRTVVNPAGAVGSLNCGSATNYGTLTRGVAASGVSSSIPYTGGNGASHNGQTVASTGVTGLTAKLNAGTFVNGAGNLSYTITGTPSAAGTANFAINIGGKTCTLTRQVEGPFVAEVLWGDYTETRKINQPAGGYITLTVRGSGGTVSWPEETINFNGLYIKKEAGSVTGGATNIIRYFFYGTPTKLGTYNIVTTIGGMTDVSTVTIIN